MIIQQEVVKKQTVRQSTAQRGAQHRMAPRRAAHPYLQAQDAVGNHGVLRRHGADVVRAKHTLVPATRAYQQVTESGAGTDGAVPPVQPAAAQSMLLEAEALVETLAPAASAFQGSPKTPPKPAKGTACTGKFLLLMGTAGPVTFPTVGKQYLLQAGKVVMKGGKVDPKATKPGSSYIGAADVVPKNCGSLQFVQNVQTHRVVTFKDKSKLELKTSMVLDTSDPYPSFAVKSLSTGTTLAVSTNDTPGQESSGAFGFIESMTVNDKFELFLMLKQKSARTTVGLAEWNWNGKADTTDKSPSNIKAPLKFSGGTVSAPNGKASTKKPKLSPNITAAKFKVVGKGKTLASVFQKLF